MLTQATATLQRPPATDDGEMYYSVPDGLGLGLGGVHVTLQRPVQNEYEYGTAAQARVSDGMYEYGTAAQARESTATLQRNADARGGGIAALDNKFC